MRWLAPAVFACAVALPTAAAAQSSTPPAGSLGGLAVVGLRTPDGDVDVASALSAALRDAATARGYQVPDNTPSFDFGSDESPVTYECRVYLASAVTPPAFGSCADPFTAVAHAMDRLHTGIRRLANRRLSRRATHRTRHCQGAICEMVGIF